MSVCTNPYCQDGWVERGDNESGGAPPIACEVCRVHLPARASRDDTELRLAEALEEEVESLALISYHRVTADGDWYADLTPGDIQTLRAMLATVAEAHAAHLVRIERQDTARLLALSHLHSLIGYLDQSDPSDYLVGAQERARRVADALKASFEHSAPS